MDPFAFQSAAATLSTEPGLALLRALGDQEWAIASEVARRADMHISTATKHLAVLSDAGVLDRRESPTRTGVTYAYRLTNTRITLVLDLDNRRVDAAPAARDLAASVVRTGESLGGATFRASLHRRLAQAFPERSDLRPEAPAQSLHGLLTGAEADADRISTVLRALRDALETSVGSIVAARVIGGAFAQSKETAALAPLCSELLDSPGAST